MNQRPPHCLGNTNYTRILYILWRRNAISSAAVPAASLMSHRHTTKKDYYKCIKYYNGRRPEAHRTLIHHRDQSNKFYREYNTCRGRISRGFPRIGMGLEQLLLCPSSLIVVYYHVMYPLLDFSPCHHPYDKKKT